MTLKQLFCRHSKVTIWRSHANVCREEHGREAWIDMLGVYNFIRCVRCEKTIPAVPLRERLFGTHLPTTFTSDAAIRAMKEADRA